MASKKSLSDLLREEINKVPSSDPQTAAEHSPAAEEPLKYEAESTKSSPAEDSNDPQMATATSARKSNPKRSTSRLTKAELESKVQSLTEGLQAAQTKESGLEQQINHLEANLEQQKASIQDLQTVLSRTQTLKTELEQAKQDALKLAQENERLQSQIDTLKQENRDLQTQVKRPDRPASLPSRRMISRPVGSPSRRMTSRPARTPTPAPRTSQPVRTPVAASRTPRPRPSQARSILERPIMPSHRPTRPQKPSKSFETWCYD